MCAGCSTYTESFTYWGPGQTNHTVKVSHHTLLMYGKAARLETETQTMEFIRNVNATDLEVGGDAKTIKAISDGVVDGLRKSVIPVP